MSSVAKVPPNPEPGAVIDPKSRAGSPDEGSKAMAGSPDALPAASRRLAHGHRPFAKTMREDRNVRDASC
jgi:hypothetical protein